MRNINGFLGLVLAGCLACGMVNASTYTYDFTGAQASNNQYENSDPYSVAACSDGCSAGTLAGYDVTAYSFGNTGSGGALQQGTLGQYSSLGLGVCDQNETTPTGTSGLGTGCSSPQHQVDNSGNVDYVLFEFATPVDLSSLALVQYANNLGQSGANAPSNVDVNFTYWTGTAGNTSFSNLIPTGGTTADDFSSGGTNVTCAASVCDAQNTDYTETISGNDVTYLLVSAQLGQTDDFFKISGIDATRFVAPEPASFGLLGLAFVGLGLAGRWKIRRGVGKS